MISYEKAPDVQAIAEDVVRALGLSHIDVTRVQFFRSRGSRARRVQARIHGLAKIWSDALAIRPVYLIEVLSEEYDKLGEEDKQRVVIHELMHIPKGFGGGFVPHKGKINRKSVEKLYRSYYQAAGLKSEGERQGTL